MKFKEKYTTAKLKEKNPDKETDKVELNDTDYALCEMVDNLASAIRANK